MLTDLNILNVVCVMSCGCKVQQKDLTTKGNSKVCPNHPDGRMMHKEFTCTECGYKFKGSKTSSTFYVCKNCGIHFKSTTPTKKKIKQSEYIRAAREMVFCKNRSECLLNCGKQLMCLECEHYKDPKMINKL